MSVNWGKEIVTKEPGGELKLLDPCFVVNGFPYKLVKMSATREGGTDLIMICREDGSFLDKDLRDVYGKVRNKPNVVWINLYQNGAGLSYFNTEKEAVEATGWDRISSVNNNPYIKTICVEI
jgi:hypothetical protein